MPWAVNPEDGCRIYYEDEPGSGSPVFVLNGLGDPIAASKAWRVTQALAREHRIVLVDHRGHGRSGKPHNPDAYAMRLAVRDLTAVLDQLEIEKAHFVGASWGGRLLFGVAEHAPKRALSLTIGGQSPYRMRIDSAGVRMVSDAFANGRSMRDFVEALGGLGDVDEETASWTLDNDFEALAAAWSNALAEADILSDPTSVTVPCLIYAGTEDGDFFELAKRAASEITSARFVALEGLNHLEAHTDVDNVLPQIERLIRDVDGA